ncbi:MAG: SDR family NAD(P)-dependent oxidoreductase [Pseudomonadota bacterium]
MAEHTNWTVITGSTGGIGQELAALLAQRGKDLILINRSLPKAESQRAELLQAFPSLQVALVSADFMDAASITRAIETILAMPGQIEALYNNAGVLLAEKVLSAQGYESHFAVNVLAPYQIIKGLRTKLARGADHPPAMVVNFSSSAIGTQKALDLQQLANPDTVTGLMGTYAQSKLAVTSLSAALAKDLERDHILIRAVDPGATKTAMTTGNAAMPKPLQWIAPLFFAPADKQAAKVVASADPDLFHGKTGILVANRREKGMPKPALDQKTQERLLDLLEQALA